MKRYVKRVGVLRCERTPHAKEMRRIYGDGSGMCRFQDKYFSMSTDGVANTVTAAESKYGLLCLEYEYEKVGGVLSALASVHPLSRKLEFESVGGWKSYSHALRASDYKCPHCAYLEYDI